MQTKKHYIHANLTTNTHIHTDTFAHTHELCEWDEVHWKSIGGEEEQTNRSVIKMGRIFLEHLGGLKLFNCAECHTNLTNRSQLISTRFTGATGEFNKCEIQVMYHLQPVPVISLQDVLISSSVSSTWPSVQFRKGWCSLAATWCAMSCARTVGPSSVGCTNSQQMRRRSEYTPHYTIQ